MTVPLPQEIPAGTTLPSVTPEQLGIGVLFWRVRDAVVVTDAAAGRVILWNPAAEAIFGYSAEEAARLTVDAFIPDALRDELTSELRRYAETGHSRLTDSAAPMEFTLIRKGGEEVIVESTVMPLAPEEHPNVPGRYLLSVSRDVTARRRSEAELRRAAVAQDLLLQSARAILWRCDAQTFHFHYVSPEAEKLLGYPVERWTSEPAFWAEHVYEEDREWALRYCAEATGALRNHEFEYRMVAADGRIVWLRDIVAVVAEQEQAIELVGVMVDITEERRLRDELRHRADELARSNADLEQFAYVASHDLQEPLRTVVSYLQLLEEDYRETLGASGKEFLDFAVDGAKRMQRLINDLLVYSRVGRRGQPFAPVHVETVVQEVLEDLHATIHETGATITYDPLPVVEADAVQLAQLLRNLISNAIKFRGAEPPRVQISAVRDDEAMEWRFSVRDNGIGIEREYLDLIFVIFQRLHLRDKYPGTGIGLAVCKKIVERHGGRIWVESAPGQGSTFAFTLPDHLPGAELHGRRGANGRVDHAGDTRYSPHPPPLSSHAGGAP